MVTNIFKVFYKNVFCFCRAAGKATAFRREKDLRKSRESNLSFASMLSKRFTLLIFTKTYFVFVERQEKRQLFAAKKTYANYEEAFLSVKKGFRNNLRSLFLKKRLLLSQSGRKSDSFSPRKRLTQIARKLTSFQYMLSKRFTLLSSLAPIKSFEKGLIDTLYSELIFPATYSTVTDFARFFGLSTSHPLATAR